MGTLDPAKTVLRYPWIWGWIQQKRFFGTPGFGGGSSKNTFSKFAEKLSVPLDLGTPPFSVPLDLGVDPAKKLCKTLQKCVSTPFSVPLQLLNVLSVPLFQYPFSCLNVISTLFQYPSHMLTVTV